MNVYRYVACGDMSIHKPENYLWVYSHVHLDEIVRNGNTDALEGIKQLNAHELYSEYDSCFKATGNVFIKKYVDPYERYEQHLEAISGYENANDFNA